MNAMNLIWAFNLAPTSKNSGNPYDIGNYFSVCPSLRAASNVMSEPPTVELELFCTSVQVQDYAPKRDESAYD